jgi:hypothetical protein
MKTMSDKAYSNFEEFIISITRNLQKRNSLNIEWVAALAANLGLDVLQKDAYIFLAEFIGSGENWSDELYLYSKSKKMNKYLNIIEDAESDFREIYSIMEENGSLSVENVAYLKLDLYQIIK